MIRWINGHDLCIKRRNKRRRRLFTNEFGIERPSEVRQKQIPTCLRIPRSIKSAVTGRATCIFIAKSTFRDNYTCICGYILSLRATFVRAFSNGDTRVASPEKVEFISNRPRDRSVIAARDASSIHRSAVRRPYSRLRISPMRLNKKSERREREEFNCKARRNFSTLKRIRSLLT